MTSQKQRHRSRHAKALAQLVSFWEESGGVSPAVFLLTCAVFVGGLLLGGGGGSFGDTFVQLMALPLIVLAAVHWSQNRLAAPDWLALAVIIGIALLGIAQLLPLPMSLWSSLPARSDLLRDMHTADVAPAWHSLSLNPYATERALQWTLPAVAMYLGVRWMSPRQRKAMLLVLFLGALGLLILTLAQNTAGQGSSLVTANEAIAKATLALNSGPEIVAPPPAPQFAGLFTNRNHFATFLAMTLPLVIAMGLRLWIDRPKDKTNAAAPLAFLLSLVMVGLLAGMIQTHSRAALILGGIALFGSLALLRHAGLNRAVVWSVVACTLLGVIAAVQMAASTTINRLDSSPGNDLRWEIHATTLKAAQHFGPWGSGLGTFVEAYQQVPPIEGYWPEYINRAHSDYHELWLETGIPGAALVIAFIGWFAWSSLRVWRGMRKQGTITLIARAASLSILTVLLHSYLDYPLRKTAILVVFGMGCALLAPTELGSERSSERKRRRSVTLPPQSATIAN